MSIASHNYPREQVRTFTHGKGWDTYETEGELIQVSQIKILIFFKEMEEGRACPKMPKYSEEEVPSMFGPIHACILDVPETVTTAKIVPGSSGGMVVNGRGELVGVVSAGDGDFGMLVTIDDINSFLAAY